MSEMEQLLNEVRAAQALYWDALSALEECLGVDVDGCADMEEVTVEDLMWEEQEA